MQKIKKVLHFHLMFGNINYVNGEVAQLARAFGSYPKGRGFDPLLRYQEEFSRAFMFDFDK